MRSARNASNPLGGIVDASFLLAFFRRTRPFFGRRCTRLLHVDTSVARLVSATITSGMWGGVVIRETSLWQMEAMC